MKAKELMKKVTGGALIAVMAVTMLAGCVSKTETPPADTKTEDSDSKDAEGDMTVAMLPKFKGENYFDACKTGAQEAADELGITLLYDGPSQDQATNQKQVDILEGWIAQGVNV
ncbi:sugar ABC transporter substrate-binding protein, partial [Romboutsia ilealis]|nr:sugar ABC transporter substrate-binding protein [Romboutsia ilealis]